MITLVSVIDVFSALGVMGILVSISVISEGALIRYMIVPVILAWVHVVGNGLQERNIGPEWIQGHLHDLGVAMPLVFIIIIIGVLRHIKMATLATFVIDMVLKITLPVHAIATLVCIGYKVIQVTIFREESIAQGYSGQLDVGDVSALVIGFIIMVINHYTMRGSVLRRKEAIMNESPIHPR